MRRINIGALYGALEAKREAEGRPWRAIAEELGISASTFTRLSQGKGTDTTRS